MRTLNERELDSVSGGFPLIAAGLTAGVVGLNLLGDLLGGVARWTGNASAASKSATTAVAPGGTHGFAPATRQPGDIFDSVLQRGAGFLGAAIQDVAGHVSAGIRDAADLVGRLI